MLLCNLTSWRIVDCKLNWLAELLRFDCTVDFDEWGLDSDTAYVNCYLIKDANNINMEKIKKKN